MEAKSTASVPLAILSTMPVVPISTRKDSKAQEKYVKNKDDKARLNVNLFPKLKHFCQTAHPMQQLETDNVVMLPTKLRAWSNCILPIASFSCFTAAFALSHRRIQVVPRYEYSFWDSKKAFLCTRASQLGHRLVGHRPAAVANLAY